MLLLTYKPQPIAYHERLRLESICQAQRQVMFRELLIKAGVTTLYVDYDGANDSGWIESITYEVLDQCETAMLELKKQACLHGYGDEFLDAINSVFRRNSRALGAEVLSELSVHLDQSDDAQLLHFINQTLKHYLKCFEFADAIKNLQRFQIAFTDSFTEFELEQLFVDLIEVDHEGWEIDGGAFGNFEWDLISGHLKHEHTMRYIDYITSHANRSLV